MNNLTYNCILKNGMLQPATEADRVKLKLFKDSLKEGQEVENYLTIIEGDTKTLGQLAKVHTLIREIASFSGHTFSEVKKLVKEDASLFKVINSETNEKELKSFGECSKEELSLAIQSCIRIGQLFGLILY